MNEDIKSATQLLIQAKILLEPHIFEIDDFDLHQICEDLDDIIETLTDN